MKRLLVFLIMISAVACNGKLSDEQRKRLADGMKRNQIKKISEARITEAAFEYGRIRADELAKAGIMNENKRDSMERSDGIRIKILYPEDKHLEKVEKQLLEAYAGVTNVQPGDNVQRFSKDSILYTRPIMRDLPDGSIQFKCALGIRTSVKQIVLSIKD